MDNREILNWGPFSTPDMERIKLLRSEGINVWDVEENKYIDAYSGLWNMNFGYGNSTIEKNIIEQMRNLPFYNPIVFSSKLNEQVAHKLINILNLGQGKVVYGCSGSEGVEIAIKIARKYSNIIEGETSIRNKIAVIDGAYHGTTYGALSATRYSVTDDGYGPMLDGFITLPNPAGDFEDNNAYYIKKLDKLFSVNKDKICAILIEPVLASAGVFILPDEYVEYIKKECEENNILLISDEVSAGFYRSRDSFGFHRYNMSPDIVVMSKGINNGYLPLSATYINSKIVSKFLEFGVSLEHMSTQGGNPICLSSANATLDYYERPLILDEIKALKTEFRTKIYDYFNDLEKVKQIRVEGLMAGIELYVNDYNELFENIKKILTKRVIVGFSYYKNKGTILIFPSYVTKKDELEIILRTIREVIKNND